VYQINRNPWLGEKKNEMLKKKKKGGKDKPSVDDIPIFASEGGESRATRSAFLRLEKKSSAGGGRSRKHATERPKEKKRFSKK